MRDVLEGHSAEFFSGIPNRVAQGLIDFEPLATERHQGHADGRILKCAGKTFFTFGVLSTRPSPNFTPANRYQRGAPLDRDWCSKSRATFSSMIRVYFSNRLSVTKVGNFSNAVCPRRSEAFNRISFSAAGLIIANRRSRSTPDSSRTPS